MLSRSGIAFVGGCAAILALSAPVLARPVHHAAKPAKHSYVAIASSQPERTSAERLSVMQRMSRTLFRKPDLVAEARRYLGTNPTDRKKLWCAAFMNLVLNKAGYDGTHSDAARSFAYYGRRISEPEIGAIAVLSRGNRGGHVGVVSGVDAQGNPIIISGNHNKTVGEATYSRARVIAYVMPTERHAGTVQVAARSTLSQTSSETTIDSPITELLAAIEAEQQRPEPRPQALRPAEARAQARAEVSVAARTPAPIQYIRAGEELPAAHAVPRPVQIQARPEAPRVAPPMPVMPMPSPTPHRTVQQLPEQGLGAGQDIHQPYLQLPRPAPQRRAGRVASLSDPAR